MNTNAETALQAYLLLNVAQRAIFNAARAALDGLAASNMPPERCLPAAVRSPASPTARPRLDDPPIDPEIFASTRFKGAATRRTAIVYFAGCDGLFRLAQATEKGGYKLGLSVSDTVHDRMLSLGEERYASLWMADGAPQKDDGFGRWEAPSLSFSEDRPRNSPVEPERRFIRVRLPAGITAKMLDVAIAQSLSDRSLATFAQSPEGRMHCDGVGLNPARLVRFTPARKVGQRPRAATELVHLSPRRDADALAQLLEAIVAGFVLGRPS